ncbi:MAG: hypothetical protein KC485_10845 [Gemmatimonadetes bacterium]|nr:hypothetical protein [Gemmatimonadota bacterium]
MRTVSLAAMIYLAAFAGYAFWSARGLADPDHRHFRRAMGLQGIGGGLSQCGLLLEPVASGPGVALEVVGILVLVIGLIRMVRGRPVMGEGG